MSLTRWLRNRWAKEAAALSADPRDLLLAALPIAVGIVGASLLFPRAVVPVRVPVPHPRPGVLEAEARREKALAAKGRADTLSASVRKLGSAFRSWNRLAIRTDDRVEADAHRQAVHLKALARSVRQQEGDEALLILRALQLETFLAELVAFEQTGLETEELQAVGGNVVERMRSVGWIEGTRTLFAEETWCVLYKSLWNRSMGLAETSPFALSLDEERELIRLQLEHPHPAEAERGMLAAERTAATTLEACDMVERQARHGADRWRLQKVESWGSRDPAYPVAFARGVLLFRLGRYPEAARAFADARERGGAYAQRAFFHERAAIVASAVD
jgi:hypothetical protein